MMCVNVFLCNHEYRHDVTKVGDFYNGGKWRNVQVFVESSRTFVPDYIKQELGHIS